MLAKSVPDGKCAAYLVSGAAGHGAQERLRGPSGLVDVRLQGGSLVIGHCRKIFESGYKGCGDVRLWSRKFEEDQ